MANGSIDQLHFKVILDDVKFGQQITKDIEKAKELNSSLTEILNLKNKINSTAKGSYLDEQKMAQAAAKTADSPGAEGSYRGGEDRPCPGKGEEGGGSKWKRRQRTARLVGVNRG